jgi:hypothetical protein
MRAAPIALVLLTAVAAAAHGQSASDQPASEDIEPRVIGTAGTTLIGFAGFVDRLSSSERAFSTNYTAQVDVGHFITRAMVVRGGLSGSGSFGGDDADEIANGSGVPAVHAFAGLFYYFRPQSLLSLYSGGEYWAQLTRRADGDAGAVVGTLGLQGVVSSRASLFVEGGYGMGLTRGDEGETVSRFVGRIGVRLKF